MDFVDYEVYFSPGENAGNLNILTCVFSSDK